MTVSRRRFLRDSAQFALVAPLVGAAAPLLAAPPPAGIDYSLITRPFVGKRVAARHIVESDVGGLTLFTGAGCNVVGLRGPEGALLIDGGHAVNASVLQKSAHRKLGTRRIDTLVNTHWHPDQTGLNELAGQDRATIVAHEVTKLCAGHKLRSPLFDGTIGPLSEAARPTRTFYDKTSFEFAGEPVEIRHLPAGHTGGDLFVHFPRRNVVVAGGPVTSDRWPIIDYRNGGLMHGLVRAYEILSDVMKPDTMIVPANGPVITSAEFVQMKELYTALFKQFFLLFNKGLGPADVVEFNAGKEFIGVTPVIADRPLKDSALAKQFGDPAQFLEFAFRSIQLATIPY
ncbi:MAG: MBL fold metallo-hydrolase [Steroidobacteraceae bacterium]